MSPSPRNTVTFFAVFLCNRCRNFQQVFLSSLLSSPNRLVPHQSGVFLVFTKSIFYIEKTTHRSSFLILFFFFFLFETPSLPLQYPVKANAFPSTLPLCLSHLCLWSGELQTSAVELKNSSHISSLLINFSSHYPSSY